LADQGILSLIEYIIKVMSTRRKYNFRIYQGDTLVSKECSECLTYKSMDEYTPDKSQKDGYKPKCKTCINQYHRQMSKDYREATGESFFTQYHSRHSEYYANNKYKWYMYYLKRKLVK
jgi:hypothetical protein